MDSPTPPYRAEAAFEAYAGDQLPPWIRTEIGQPTGPLPEQRQGTSGFCDRHFRTVIGELGYGAWEYYADEDLLHWDARCCDFYGVNHHGFRKRFSAWQDLLNFEDGRCLKLAFEACLQGRSRELNLELRFRMRSGMQRLVQCFGMAFGFRSGKIALFSGVQRILADGHAGVTETDARTAPFPKRETGRILVLEPDLKTQQSVAGILRRLGCSGFPATGPDEAVRAYGQAYQAGHPFELVILGINGMQECTDHPALNSIRRLDPQAACAWVGPSGMRVEARESHQNEGEVAWFTRPYSVGMMERLLSVYRGPRPY